MSFRPPLAMAPGAAAPHRLNGPPAGMRSRSLFTNDLERGKVVPPPRETSRTDETESPADQGGAGDPESTRARVPALPPGPSRPILRSPSSTSTCAPLPPEHESRNAHAPIGRLGAAQPRRAHSRARCRAAQRQGNGQPREPIHPVHGRPPLGSHAERKRHPAAPARAEVPGSFWVRPWTHAHIAVMHRPRKIGAHDSGTFGVTPEMLRAACSRQTPSPAMPGARGASTNRSTRP